MSIKDAEKEALRLASLCERGLHPREYDRQQQAKKQSSVERELRRQRTLGQIIKQYVNNKRLQQQNSESYIKERDNSIKHICSDWFTTYY